MAKNIWESEIAPPGSSLYYSLLGVGSPQREAVVVLQAFHYEINKISERYHEASVALAKLAWWEQEIKQSYQGQASHPIMQALQDNDMKFAIPEATLLAMIAAAKLAMETQIYPTQSELSHHYQHTGGLIELLKTRVLAGGVADIDTEQYAQTLGIALATIQHLYDFAAHLQRGHIYLPADLLAQHQINLEELLQKQQLEKLTPVFKQQAGYAREQYIIALARLPKTQVSTQRSGRIYAKLQLKLLDAMEYDGFQVFQHQVQLSPLKKLWWSWRAA